MRLALALLALLLAGCTTKFGPGPDGYFKAEMCTYEGGYKNRIAFGAAEWEFGCTDPPQAPVEAAPEAEAGAGCE